MEEVKGEKVEEDGGAAAQARWAQRDVLTVRVDSRVAAAPRVRLSVWTPACKRVGVGGAKSGNLIACFDRSENLSCND
jgi:hypothetical protein